jgi:hypothetical protein
MTDLRRIASALACTVVASVLACGGSTSSVEATDGGVDAGASDARMDATGDEASAIDAGDASSRDATHDAPGDATRPDSGAPQYHRPSDAQCQTTPPMGNCRAMGTGMCTSDSSCTTGTNGRCVENVGGALFCFCSYDACMHDTDCPTGQLCVCHGSAYSVGGNTCMAGNCRVDADCASGYCSPSHGNTGCGAVTGYYCRTPGDSCVNDSDCPTTGGPHVCAWSATNARWECQQQLLCP